MFIDVKGGRVQVRERGETFGTEERRDTLTTIAGRVETRWFEEAI